MQWPFVERKKKDLLSAMFNFDPRELIMGPFIMCPKCNGVEFGILSVGPDRYQRQCRDCRFRNSTPLPEIRKTIIYLDQFAISNLTHVRVKGSKVAEPFWHGLYKKLERRSVMQLIVCPMSVAHTMESVVAARGAQFQKGAEMFSHRLLFTDFESIRHSIILKALDQWIKDPNASMPKVTLPEVIYGDPHEWSNRWRFTTTPPPIPGFADAIRADRDAAHSGLVLGVFENEWKRHPNRSWDHWYNAETSGYVRELLKSDIAERQKWEDVRSGKRKLSNIFEALPQPVLRLFAMMRKTIERAGVDKDDVPRKVREFLASKLLLSAPFIRISSSLYASLAMKAPSQQKRPTKGFFTDVDVISCLLPYCDAMLLDRECCAYWREIQSSKNRRLPYATRVFSLASKNEFMAYLDEIDASALPDHRRLVREVYDYPREASV